jgi:hypothetical protein
MTETRARFGDLIAFARSPPATLQDNARLVAQLLRAFGWAIIAGLLYALLALGSILEMVFVHPESIHFDAGFFILLPITLLLQVVLIWWVGWVKRHWETGQDPEARKLMLLCIVNLVLSGWSVLSALTRPSSGPSAALSGFLALVDVALLVSILVFSQRATRSTQPAP